jgi:hypothetical protein
MKRILVRGGVAVSAVTIVLEAASSKRKSLSCVQGQPALI